MFAVEITTAIHATLTDKRIADIRFRHYLEYEMRAWVADEVLPELKTYPPELQGQRYFRTYRLRQGWDEPDVILVDYFGDNGLAVDVQNPAADYWIWVQGRRSEQAAIHQGRWRNLDDIAATHNRSLYERKQRAAVKTFESMGWKAP